MKYHPLGKSGLSVSEIGFGCMSLGTDHAANARLLQGAVDGGITLFDTADLYSHGHNEITVGRALAGVRHRVVLATKVGNQWRPDGSGWDWNPRRAYILAAAEASLRRLGTDCIDLYQLHGGTLDDPMDEVIEAFERLRQQGKISHYGLSSIRPAVIRAYTGRWQGASVMMQYSLLDRRPEESCLGLLHEKGIGMLARGGLAKGLLAGKPPEAYLGHTAEDVRRAAEKIARTGRPAVEAALRLVLHHPDVTAAVVGVRTKEQLRQLLAAAQSAPLTAAEYQRLVEAVPAHRYQEHR